MRRPEAGSASHAQRLFLCAAAALLVSAPAAAAPLVHPLRFFEGRTESSGTVTAFLKRAYRTFAVGRGRIEPDGTLILVQHVEDEGRAPRQRRWRIREVGPGRFSGTMSEAVGPVTIDQVGGRYRFRFRMKDKLAIEQWLVPLAGGTSARSKVTVRKLGITVGTSEGTIRRIAGR